MRLTLSVAEAVPTVDILVTATGWPLESKYAGTPRTWGATARVLFCGKPADVGVVCGLLLLFAAGCEPTLGGERSCDTLERPARREMRSARSASRLPSEAFGWWPARWFDEGRWPRWPSLIAVVDRAEREVVVEVGVPLEAAHRMS